MKPVIHVPRVKPNISDKDQVFSLSRKPSILQLSSPRNALATTRQVPIQDPFLNMRQLGTNSPKLRPICPLKHPSSGPPSLNSSNSQRSLGIDKHQKPLSVSDISNKPKLLARNNSACIFPPISTRNILPIKESKHFFKELKEIQLKMSVLRDDFFTKKEKKHGKEKIDFKMSKKDEPTTPYFNGNSQASFQKHVEINYESESTNIPESEEEEVKQIHARKASREHNLIETDSKFSNFTCKETGRRDMKELTFKFKR
ncbi:unnamed protein product [Blepharisma stoltei]|uniref:Exophilin 5 n=1 Tax=Blepharisma stoltei TaxID=1481888 RepID=A0AAU9J4S2_9CILI|nr:unnamed protein product [Blepharisma stoltei]